MPQFKVIRASAGSGKTFNLTGEYLRVLFTERDAFMHILAVTFTNKATAEMKGRILNELFLLSSGQTSKQLPGLITATSLTESQIRNKAMVILKKLLHRYSSFSVTTIDSFFQRIIRNFTRELGIQEGYAIELDTSLVLSEIIDSLLSKCGQDKALLNWLTQFAESLIEKGESWNIRKGISELGKEIFREEFKSLNESSMKRFADREYLDHYRITLIALRSNIEKKYREFGKKAMTVMIENGLSVEDFAYGNDGPAGYLRKVSEGVFEEPKARANQASTCADKWCTKSSPLKGRIITLASAILMPIISEAIDYYNVNSTSYNTSQVILKNLYALGILIDLSKLADLWCSENNAFLLPEAPVFLNRIIDGNDTPFIYEKAGCWYHHFMIDEFQDTSLMQWLNFRPLISNSLSLNYDNLAVGDTKQSIYRWRNSNWEILENQVYNDFSSGIINDITLKENWRSKPEIIRFNNEFFKAAASVLQQSFEEMLSSCTRKIGEELMPVTRLYASVEQTPGDAMDKGGHVRVEFISEEEDQGFKDAVNVKVVNLLHDLLSLGYHLDDIAILTRTNNEAAELAGYILEKAEQDGKRKIEVISDEALQLRSSVVVNTLIALIRYIANPADRTNNYYLSSLCANYILNESESVWISPDHKFSGPRLPEDFITLASTGKSYSLIEITERIIKIFGLEKHYGESVYLMAFRDMIIEYSSRQGSNIPGFLDYWEETGQERSVSAPAGQDAVRILTMHKSKGLEFRITIIPYCNWQLIDKKNKTILWCKPEEEPFKGLPLLPLVFSSNLNNTIFAADYFMEVHKQYIDNLNLMYVALTRAREAMFVFCKGGDKDQLRTVSDLSRKILGNKLYVSGEPGPCTVPEEELHPEESIRAQDISQSGMLSDISSRIKIAFQGELIIDPSVNKPSRPLDEGKILHDIFKLIRRRNDIKESVMQLYLQGKIAADEQNKYVMLISHAMNDIQVSTWFSDEWKVINEAEIILPEGVIKRPDRVMVKDNHTIVVDYKFGNKTESSYESQLREYASLLNTMGYKNVEAYLWYVRLGKIVNVI